MNKFNADMQRYLHKIRCWLPCSRNQKKRITDKICTTVYEYLMENTKANYEDIVARFGAPEDIAATYVSEMELSKLLSYLRIKKTIKATILTFILLAFILWVSTVSFAMLDASIDNYGSYERIVTEDEININQIQEVNP